jgi:hypothetical protein
MTHLDTSNASYGQKKGWESNWQFDSWPVKIGSRPNFLMYRWLCDISLKIFWQGLQVCFKLHLNRRFAHKVMGPQSCESFNFENFQDSHLGVLGQNSIWVLVPWLGIEYIIRGKVVASPKSGLWWVLWVWVCMWFFLVAKVLKLCTNQLVCLVCVAPYEWLITCHSS